MVKPSFILPVEVNIVDTGSTIAVHELAQKLPAYHDIINLDIRVLEACLGTSGTICFGVDDDSDPDDLIDDTNVSSLTLDALVRGIPQDGANKLAVGTTDKPINYRIKTTAFTAGKLLLLFELRPTK